uniref:Acetyltransferase (GNAT) family protein n=1 Tax=Pithovirus LCPAC304 TaxID=2506594 RepID=A0A481Z8G7_9VIRU|nr:MAG: acetyltransferase (GNAT) family protein [Pithovirus LCPAC304]
MKLVTKHLKDDPWMDDIPLSHDPFPNGSFVGYLVCDGDLATMARIYHKKGSKTAELADVYVAYLLRGKVESGGKKWSHLIMEKILAAAKRRGIHTIWLWVTADNIPAIKLYEKYGFKVVTMSDALKNKMYDKHRWLKGKKILRMKLRM